MSTSAAEATKLASRHLRGTLAEELVEDTTDFSADSQLLLKFHGVYQQDDRDQRRVRTQAKQGLAYSCMVRASVPGGVLTAEQYLVADTLADKVADGSLRITTRQGLQYHGVLKSDLRHLIATLNEELVSTLAACGDVVRNVTCCPAHLPGRSQASLLAAAKGLAVTFRPDTGAYYEVWIDGEQAVTVSAAPVTQPADAPAGVEPLYGDTYLPRKFKIGFAWPGDNCIDVFTHDAGIVPIERHGEAGYVVLVGGGLGQSHAREDDTYPRLATPLAWVPEADLSDVVRAVVLVQRDHGNRDDRARARLKYTIDTIGESAFRSLVEARLGRPLIDPVELPPFTDSQDHLGWWLDADGRWVLGVQVPSGRVRDTDDVRLRTALRTVIDRWLPEVRFTARQDVLLCGFAAEDRVEVERVLSSHNVPMADALSGVHRHAIACPALPTCGQALGEAERVLPQVADGLHGMLVQRGLGGIALRVNMTGCPNGCARPYTAEVGIVGRTKSTYDLYLGGSVGGERLAQRVAVGLKLGDLPGALDPIVARYGAERLDGESFGDYCHRVGETELATLVPAPPPRRGKAAVDEAD